VEAQKLDYIDAVRGWAILLVITCHVGGMSSEMPYPIKKLTNFGWHGVQLFFLASALTLMMSWHRVRVHDGVFVRSFFIRRFLRIAPMYYAGAAIYFIAEPPVSGFNLPQMLISFTFLNTWRPEWIPKTPGWMVVPGGWSIGVEFTFYALFPLLAALVTSLPRALAFFAAAFAFACGANHLGATWLAGYPADAVGNFLYSWFPNQVPVFALGFVLYFTIKSYRVPTLGKWPACMLLACVAAALISVAEFPASGHRFLLSTPTPPILLASLGFTIFIFVLARQPDLLLTSPLMKKMEVLSFSAYVLHFLFIHSFPAWSGGWINTRATGYVAIANLVLLWAVVVPTTFAAASLAHAWIERPGMELARRLTSKGTLRAVQRA